MKQEINVFDYTKEILESVKKGVLLTTKADGQVNTMTISWGTLGIEWSTLIFTVFVRENRFTHQQLEKNGEFTINIPYGEYDKNILNFCGTKTGYETNKIKELGLTLEEAIDIDVPAIKELPLTLECRVVYKQKQDESQITPMNKERFYPQNIASTFHGSNKDYHTAYYGEIVRAYIVK